MKKWPEIMIAGAAVVCAIFALWLFAAIVIPRFR